MLPMRAALSAVSSDTTSTSEPKATTAMRAPSGARVTNSLAAALAPSKKSPAMLPETSMTSTIACSVPGNRVTDSTARGWPSSVTEKSPLARTWPARSLGAVTSTTTSG